MFDNWMDLFQVSFINLTKRLPKQLVGGLRCPQRVFPFVCFGAILFPILGKYFHPMEHLGTVLMIDTLLD